MRFEGTYVVDRGAGANAPAPWLAGKARGMLLVALYPVLVVAPLAVFATGGGPCRRLTVT